MTAREIQEAVDAGARFVFYQFCISALVITFKRSSPVYFLKAGEGTLLRGAPFTLISLVGGWWGIPWGPIWTVSTVITNLSGGKDVTQQILAALGTSAFAQPGRPGAPAAAMLRKPPLSTTQKVLIGGSIALAVLAVIGMGYLVVNHAVRLPRTPGEAELRGAVDLLDSGKPSGSGNSPEARKLATDMSQSMAKMREKFFQKATRVSVLDSHDAFRTYCDLRENQCLFLVHVPELRRFTSDAKDSLGKSAWAIAHGMLKSRGQAEPGMRLAVALRGISSFERVLMGTFEPEHNTDSPGVTTVRKGYGSEKELYPWFAPTNAVPRAEQP